MASSDGATDPGDPLAPVHYAITRPELAIESIAGNARLVILGEPGPGKTTVLEAGLAKLQAQLDSGIPEWIAAP